MKTSISIVLIVFALFSCKQNDSTKQATEDQKALSETIFQSEDSEESFHLKLYENGAELTIQPQNETYQLEQVRAASGAKYADDKGHTFWNKGDSFLWMKGDDIIAEGSIINDKDGIAGSYVSSDYSKRQEGYDWVAVQVSNLPDNRLEIKIRSRADKKKPTCTYDAIAYQLDDNTYESIEEGKQILFTFSNNQVTIDAKEEDKSILSFYCSGGGSLVGVYNKLKEPMDDSQLDKTQFSKTLTLQDVGFTLSSIKKNGKTQLTVSTFGLTNEFHETLDLGNQMVVNAEVEDLNSDGSPELIVFTKENMKQKNNVYAFSVNNKKSMSSVYFQPIEENSAINEGYQGKDEFAIVETSLVQRFPIFKDDKETNKTRQIQYQLVDGEASRKFEVKNVTQY